MAKRAYWSGLAGLTVILAAGFLFSIYNVSKQGWHILGYQISQNFTDSVLLVLAGTALAMFVVEFVIRLRVDEKPIIDLHPALKENRLAFFIIECAFYYTITILILYLLVLFYQNAIEYGFGTEKEMYQNWFSILDRVFWLFIYFYFFYLLITRALQHDDQLDKKDPVHLLVRFFFYLVARAGLSRLAPSRLFNIEIRQNNQVTLNNNDLQSLLALMVKAFYLPLMSVFFIDQFTSYTNNWGYLLNKFDPGAATYGFKDATLDMYNISFTVIFVIDVGLAWCGYMITSRWIKNGIKSTEPTFLGWSVALLCYPPFNSFLHLYFTTPSDKDFLALPAMGFVFVLCVLSLLSYFLYMSATVMFGLRFSNLTNRGIITTGPYRFIRHPAYAGKNISWWFVMLPFILYSAYTGETLKPLTMILGLVLMTLLYYYRAITEERHLGQDEEYKKYCEKVKYRFIPGIL